MKNGGKNIIPRFKKGWLFNGFVVLPSNFSSKMDFLHLIFVSPYYAFKLFVEQFFYTIRLIKFSFLLRFLLCIKYACFDVLLSMWKCDSIKD